MSATVNQPPVLDSTGQSIIQKLNSIKSNLERNFKIIEPNPQDQATDDLTKLKIGSTVFDVSGGSGGSSVEVIPELTTGILIARMVVDGVNYSIYAPEDSGGGGSEEGTMIAKFTDVTRIGNPMGLSLDAGADITSFTNTASNNLIPIMTSNSTPRGTASSSSDLSYEYPAWRAFDENTSYWIPTGDDSSPYISYSWGSLTTLSKIVICTYNNGPTSVQRTITVQGLDSNDDWVNCLDTGNDITLDFTSYKPIAHFIDLDGNDYKAIKVSGTGNWYTYGSYACMIEAIEAY